MRKLLVLAVLLTFVTLAFAQWSSDPASNNVVSNLSGDQAIPKTAATDENVYFGWYSNDAGSYQMRLQMFNADGVMQWAENGILISDNTQETWLTDWDMTADNEGNAILTFNDSRSGNWDIYAYKISPSGEFLWGDDGIQLSTGTGMDAAPVVEVTEANNVYVAWSAMDESKSYVQKLNSDGTLPWAAAHTIEGENSYTWPQLIPVDTDNVIVKYFDDSGPTWAPNRYPYARKIDADGNSVWLEDTVISNAGGISAWNQIFSIANDGANGFFITWHEDRDNDMNANAYLQHIAADGSTSFMNNGIEVVMQMDHEHFYPYVAYDQASELIYVFWDKTDMDQNNHGISGQKLNMDGELLWGDLGTEFMALGGNGILPFSLEEVDGDVICIYDITTDAINGNVKALRVDADGEMVWTGGHVFVSSQTDVVSHMEATEIVNNQIISTWSGTGIYAQNLNIDGTIGASVGNGFITGTVTLSGAGDVTEVLVSTGTVSTNPIADGTYSLELSAGSYDITASLESYEDLTIADIAVVGGETTTGIDFALVEVESFDPPANVQMDNVTGVLTWSAPGAGGVAGLEEGFETWPPEGWMFTDEDSDGYQWDDGGALGLTAHTGTGLAYSASYDNTAGALNPDNWLISPAVTVGANANVNYWVAAQDDAWAGEHYGVYVSTTGTDVNDFELVFEETMVGRNGADAVEPRGSRVQGTWYEKNVDLSAYTGTIYVAFRHFNVSDMYFLDLDDITISSGSTRELTGYNVYLDGSLLEMTTATNYTYANLMNGTSYTAAVSAVYNDETESELVNVEFVYDGVDSPEDNVNSATALLGNYPNPFNPNTTISFSLQNETNVSLEVYNVKGQKVSTLANRVMESGSHQLSWNGTDNAGQSVSSGIYFYRLTTDNFSSSHKMMLMK